MLALPLLILIIIPHLNNIMIASASLESSSQSIANNFELVALFLYRGPIYSTIGEHVDPEVKFLSQSLKWNKMSYSE